ncbi:MAG TPA: PepSY-associated TM helix domain-containing protein [Thermoanaerobaculia bacterium]|nr:PepSY-associated TM helix domain-containing protein [Thermoanaerobaculia bacterium]
MDSYETDAAEGPSATPKHGLRKFSRGVFYVHLWLGILISGVVLLVSVTGILLNHKRPLGLMPDVGHTPNGSFEQALPLAELARRAEAAVTPEVAAAGIDRMDVRPGDGLVKVRFDDRTVQEVDVDLNTGRVLHVGERNDVFLEKLHSGEIFGDNWVLLTDASAVALIVLLLSGYWLWLFPRARS